jgi:hypothetical protein
MVAIYSAKTPNLGMIDAFMAIGYQSLNQYYDCGAIGDNWEAIESVQQTLSPLSSAPPKYQGIANYAAGTT